MAGNCLVVQDLILRSSNTGKMVVATLYYVSIIILLQFVQVITGSNRTCPQKCQCYLDIHKAITVDCSSKQLYDLPKNIPPNATRLNISNNYFSELFNSDSIQEYVNGNSNSSSNSISLITILEENPSLIILDLSRNAITESPIGITHYSVSLRQLYLAENNISTFLKGNLHSNQSTQLEVIDLKSNSISYLSVELFIYCPQLDKLLVDNNKIQIFGFHFFPSETKHNITFISLSYNEINYLDSKIFIFLSNLEFLDLSNNNIISIDGIWSLHCSNINKLSLGNNPILMLPNNSFRNCKHLTELDLSGLTKTVAINSNSLNGLTHLESLNMSYSNVKIIHPDAFSHVNDLKMLDLSYNSVQFLYENTFRNESSTIIKLEGNPWTCNCDTIWLTKWLQVHSNVSLTQPLCSAPHLLHGLSLFSIPADDIQCTRAQILNYTKAAYFKIGSSVTLDCFTNGSPIPNITWKTPKKEVFVYHPVFADYTSIKPNSQVYHSDHYWHNKTMYISKQVKHKNRIHLLSNGSLYIDYILRTDAGKYICYTHNNYGNASVTIRLTLDYLMLFENTLWSIIFGTFCAIVFLLFGLTVGLVRIIATKCSRSEKEKRKGIAQVLHNINDYRSAKFGQFSAYKTAKMDQLSAFKNDKVDKLRTYKQATLHSVLQHMQTLREHYTSQMSKVKDNCSQQVEKLRENYSHQASKFKLYKSSKVGRLRGYKAEKMDKLREHYNNQALKIRDYGSQQMTKLRDQYKLQQQHLLKLLELLDIGNCMSAIEAECMRTDSVIFNDSLMDLNLDTTPVHVIIDLSDSSAGDSEYLTAGSLSDISCSGNSIKIINETRNKKTITNLKVARPKKRKRKRRKKREKETGCGENTSKKDVLKKPNTLIENSQENIPIGQSVNQVIPFRKSKMSHQDLQDEHISEQDSLCSSYISMDNSNDTSGNSPALTFYSLNQSPKESLDFSLQNNVDETSIATIPINEDNLQWKQTHV